MDRAVVKELLDAGKLPNLAALAAQGSFRNIEVRGHVTVTRPGHAEMLTGLRARDSGVYSNRRFGPIPEGCTLFERVKESPGGRGGVRTIMVSGSFGNVGAREPLFSGRPAPSARAKSGGGGGARRLNANAPFYQASRALDVLDAAPRGAAATGALCLNYLERFHSPRFAAFFHFADTDHAGHKRGSASQEYRQAAMRQDVWLGRIAAWLREQDLERNTLIYVMADHGFQRNSRGHAYAPHSWLATNDKTVVRGGILADVPATILAHYGVNTRELQPPLIGYPLSLPKSAIAPGDRADRAVKIKPGPKPKPAPPGPKTRGKFAEKPKKT